MLLAGYCVGSRRTDVGSEGDGREVNTPVVMPPEHSHFYPDLYRVQRCQYGIVCAGKIAICAAIVRV
jgi:hypothetical protein